MRERCAKHILSEEMAAVELSRLPGVGAGVFRGLVRCHGLPSRALAAYQKMLPSEAPGFPMRSKKKSETRSGLEAAAAFLGGGGRLVYFGGPGYPGRLNDLKEPPPVLFIRGVIPLEPMIAVVGTRKADPAGIELAKRVAKFVVGNGRIVVSGGAAGIDSAAHRAALDAGGRTVAVLGTGVDVVFPAMNAALFEEIASLGALLSELLPGTGPRRGFFPTRNRIVAGLSDETIVIQAPGGSGACLTARLAEKFGRIVRVVVPPDAGDAWEGNRALLSRGALPFLFSD